jgi:hypothetical protein
VRFEQRVVPRDGGRGSKGLWLGTALPGWADLMPKGRYRPKRSDWYVTVDERVGAVVGLVASPWPTRDEEGRPRFAEEMRAAWTDATVLQEVIDGFRRARREVVRPLRIGDAFAVRGPEVVDPRQWEALWDVTKAARMAAKAAVATITVGELADPGALFRVAPAEAADETPAQGEGPPPAPSIAGPSVASPAV